MVLELTEDTFNENVIDNQKIVLVDFYTDWCGPCRIMSPRLKKLAENVKDQYVIAKINIDKNYNMTKRFSIRSIPTMIIFKLGEEVKRVSGIKDVEYLEELLSKS